MILRKQQSKIIQKFEYNHGSVHLPDGPTKYHLNIKQIYCVLRTTLLHPLSCFTPTLIQDWASMLDSTRGFSKRPRELQGII